ncbi:MAG: c-type cytochrome [Acidobacteriota bacterium]|nr:c-type cytochrome [Acidobacteriota bacterium]
MTRIIFIVCFTGIVSFAHAQTGADVAAGAKTFRSHCAACHGLNGEGGRGPNLALGVFYHGSSDADLLNTISNGVPGTEMPGLFYSEDRIRQLVAYIRSLNAGSATKPHGDAIAGAALFREKECNGCHRVKGEGGRLGPDLTNIGSSRSLDHLARSIVDPNADVPERYWVVNATGKDGKKYSGFLMNEDTYNVQFIDFGEQLHSVSKSRFASYKLDKISKMPSYNGKLSGGELDDIVAYLSSLRLKPEPSEGVSQ